MPASFPIELRERIVRAHMELGLRPAEIAETFAVSSASVRRLIAKAENDESLEPGVGSGRPAKLGKKELDWVRRKLEADPYLTSYELSAHYNREFRSNRVHRSTILRAMHALGYTFKKRHR